MALAHKFPPPAPVREERRRFQRVKVHLLGRYMLQDHREFPCQVVNMSPGGLAMYAPGIGTVGERVIAYLDHIGRVEGKITRLIDNGFAMTVSATPRKRDKLAAQLTWLANRQILNLPEDRRHDRIVPRNPLGVLTLDNGSKRPLPYHGPVVVGRGRQHRLGDSGPKSAPPSRSAACSRGWSVTSRKASRSSSCTRSFPRLSKIASPPGKRRDRAELPISAHFSARRDFSGRGGVFQHALVWLTAPPGGVRNTGFCGLGAVNA